MIKKRFLLAAALATGVVGAAVEAAVLSQYTFPTVNTSNETGSMYQPTTLASGVTGTAITDPNSTIIFQSSDAAMAPAHAPYLRVDPNGGAATSAAAVTANKYFTFTVNADAGNELDLSDLTFLVARGGGGTPRGYTVRSSADNFAANLGTADVGTVRPDFSSVTIPLTDAAFQDLSSITFRIYSHAPNAGNSVDYDNITVNGTVSVVPEPAALSAVALGTLLIGRRRRRCC